MEDKMAAGAFGRARSMGSDILLLLIARNFLLHFILIGCRHFIFIKNIFSLDVTIATRLLFSSFSNGVKETKMAETEKSSLISSVSTLFARDWMRPSFERLPGINQGIHIPRKPRLSFFYYYCIYCSYFALQNKNNHTPYSVVAITLLELTLKTL